MLVNYKSGERFCFERMNNMNYLDLEGLKAVWAKFKTQFYNKSEIDTLRKTDGGNYNAELIEASVVMYSTSLNINTIDLNGNIYYDSNSCLHIELVYAAMMLCGQIISQG